MQVENNWSDILSPNSIISYNHVFIQTCIGKFTISWKSWESDKGYCLETEKEFIGFYDSLDKAKSGFKIYIENIITELNDYTND